MDESNTIRLDLPIPLFPLSDCVAMPHVTVPLHIFEYRYRQMISDVLDSHGQIAMAVFAGDDWKDDYEGRPPIRPVVCVGTVTQYHRLEDGRFNIMLQGECRAVVRDEDWSRSKPYRLGRLALACDRSPTEMMLAGYRARILALINDSTLHRLKPIQTMSQWLKADIPTVELIDQLIMATTENSEQRYDMLAEPDVMNRCRWLERQLQRIRAALTQF